MDAMVKACLQSAMPVVRLTVSQAADGASSRGPQLQAMQAAVQNSAEARGLLAERQADGTVPGHPYAKWAGAHWILACLADIGYPAGDRTLLPLRQQVYQWLFSPGKEKPPCIGGRIRTCASQEGNALYYLCRLGLEDGQTAQLAERLIHWQWPDGGWNCDRNSQAEHASFTETLLPLRGLAAFGAKTGHTRSRQAALAAAEVFLQRRLFRSQRSGQVISEKFLQLRYPWYWHYDILFALKVIAEAELLDDERCQEALDVLEEKRFGDETEAPGALAAEVKHYHRGRRDRSGFSPVDWGGSGQTKPNWFVTANALAVLLKSGRLG